jgi:hypothetical protein
LGLSQHLPAAVGLTNGRWRGQKAHLLSALWRGRCQNRCRVFDTPPRDSNNRMRIATRYSPRQMQKLACPFGADIIEDLKKRNNSTQILRR